VTGDRERDARDLLAGRSGAHLRPYTAPPVSASATTARDDPDDVAVADDNIDEGVGSRVLEADSDDAVGAERGSEGIQPVEDILLPTRMPVAEPEVDLEIKVAPELPRICRTCRDFRPAEGGARGWCANEWAFTHRRMVDGDDPMPCETSLGSWWLPADEMWAAQADVSSHGQPTPLMDAIVGHHRDEPLRRRGS
jgi:hypothetical protein